MNQYGHTVLVLNMLLCTAAAGGLFWRLIGRWMISWPLAKWVVGLFTVLELIVAFASAYRAAAGGSFNPVQYFITAHALTTLVIIAIWPKITSTKPTRDL